ncbi:putative transmembrane regulatory nosR transcription regulator protein [Sterolibacterium denitrificans]|uniref:Transmembrane regulatory nosR transcription regulator protein n=1 Tax=Sterolibacterium denitrificans TaxID=157592 RepID=A0A7Z7HQC0_9PROT|nr:4Fe-4S binding protein [Sterolibacterium denitrificans]SMB24786.1 putative transmembrane regulatory nosR transcription regulator protein [Sterolibacterium denitrificans]
MNFPTTGRRILHSAALIRFFCILLTALQLSLLPAQEALADSTSSFARVLPEQLFSDPDMCAYAPCSAVLPDADSFSPRTGRPPYVAGYRSEGDRKQLVGYVFLSTDIVDIPGYSGKPVITLIGMNRKGIITGIRILKHSEPLLLSGIPESTLIGFIDQYVGKYVGDKLEIGESRPNEGVIGLDAISGATVTVISQNQVVLHSGIAIAKQVGILKSTERPAARLTPATRARHDWPALLREGSIRRLTVEPATLGLPVTGRPYMDLYFGYLNAPDIGRSILGEAGYENLMSRLKRNEHAIFVVANGTESFKGVGFVHGGIFDRILIGQDLDSFTFRDIDSLLLDEVHAEHAPPFSETAIFILRSANFSAAYPWRLVFRASKRDHRSGSPIFTNFEQDYWLPTHYLEGGHPSYTPPDPTWLRIWKKRPLEIVLFILLLLAAAGVYALRDELSRRASHKDKRWVSVPKYAIWLASIGFTGFYLMAQPSITQVTTLLHALLFKWEWPLFLSDPFIFLFWWFIIITVFFWGRGLFCGWLCPYGTMSELLYKLGGRLGLKRWQRQLPPALHEKLKWLKYVIFFVLLVASFHSLEFAEQLAEVEPFKTTFLVGVWNRSWPFVLFWSVLIGAALFTERPYCKYLCPLGAGLAIPSTFRWWGLQRKQACGPCKACAVGCESHAIDRKNGQIDQRECLACLDCIVLYYDDHACPPLSKERKQRLKAGQPLTRIGSDGYYIPILPAATTAAGTESKSESESGKPQRLSVAGWMGAELLDLFPWRGRIEKEDILANLIGSILAVLVTWAWLLGAAGKLDHLTILGWWLAWSAYEIAVRMQTKPVVREGPWWQRRFRQAGWADMAAYVGIKNILLASLLFFIIQSDTGLGPLLQHLPEMGWPN